MKHLLGTAALAVGAFVFACFGASTVAEAGQIKVAFDSTKYTGQHGGGEFKVTLFTGGPNLPPMGSGVQVSGGVFQTFCLERNETLNSSTTFDFTIADAAVRGGYSGQDTTIGGLSADTLDAKTAYLYQKFWLGTLSGYDYTLGSSRTASATALQLAIWKIEGELEGNSTSTDLSVYYNDTGAIGTLARQFYLDAVTNAGSSVGTVRVLNLTFTDTNGVTQRQSLLVVVPLPSSAWLGLGMMSVLGLVGAIRRRKRQALV